MSKELVKIRTEEERVAFFERGAVMIASATTAEECKRVVDIGKAAELYAKAQRLGEETEARVHAWVIDAKTKLGEMLKAGDKNKGGGDGSNQHNRATCSKTVQVARPPTREELFGEGGRKVASDAQALAKIKTAAPDLHEKVRNGKATISKARLEIKRREKRAEARVVVADSDKPSGNWEVKSGDSLELLGNVENRSARLIFADPPYNIGYDYGAGHNDKLPHDKYLDWCRKWIGLCADKLTSDGSLWVLINDEYAAEYNLILQEFGLTIRNWVIWYETFGVNCSDKFNRTHRHLFYAVKNPRCCAFYLVDEVTRPSDRQTKYNDKRASADGKIIDDVWTDIPRLAGSADEREPDFPTQLPLALLRRVVRCTSQPGDLVIDPFNGSGTTGVAAVESGRRYLGMERNPDFAERATQRIRRAEQEKP